MSYVAPKDFRDAVLTAARAYDWSTVGTVVWRVGPIRAIRLDGTEAAIGIIEVAGIPEGERSAGSGNHWWHDWDLTVHLLVPDDEADPVAAEDARLDLLELFGQLVHANRDIGPGAKVTRLGNVELQVGTLFANSDQIFRAAKLTLTYKTLRS